MLSIEYHVRLLLRKIVEILVNVEGDGDGDGDGGEMPQCNIFGLQYDFAFVLHFTSS